MKSLFFAGSLLFFAMSTQAHEHSLHDVITHEVMNTLEEGGALKSLSGNELDELSIAVDIMVAQELASITLVDGAQSPFLFDTIKSVAKKGFDLVKKGVSAVGSVAKKIKGKAGKIVKTLGPYVSKYAKKILPALVPMAEALAASYGVPPGVISGIIGMLSASDQKNPKLVQKHVQTKLLEAAN